MLRSRSGEEATTGEAQGTRLRFELGSRWLGRLRPTKRVRPLQISEVVQAVEEHLRAAALVSLESRFLPTRLIVRLSEADWSSLSPFERHLRRTIAESYARLAEQPKLAVMMNAPSIRFDPAPHLSLGDPPVLESSFDDRVSLASWWPGKDQVEPRDAPSAGAYSEDGLFEVMITASPHQGTARQSVVWVCLAKELPPGFLEEDERSTDRDESAWKLDDAADVYDLSTPLPALEGFEAEDIETRVWRFERAQHPDVLWAPGGVLILGREAGRSHWAPGSAPRNLSGRHLALVLDGGSVAVADLASTNGSFVDGARLVPLRPRRLQTPATVDIGTEGTMRLEIRAGVRLEG